MISKLIDGVDSLIKKFGKTPKTETISEPKKEKEEKYSPRIMGYTLHLIDGRTQKCEWTTSSRKDSDETETKIHEMIKDAVKTINESKNGEKLYVLGIVFEKSEFKSISFFNYEKV